jgi:hypothetical protein
VESNGPSGVSLLAALAIAGAAVVAKQPAAPTIPVVTKTQVVASASPSPHASAAPTKLELELAALKEANRRPASVDLRAPELAAEIRELRKMLQTCSFQKAGPDGKVMMCGRCFFCTFRKISLSR